MKLYSKHEDFHYRKIIIKCLQNGLDFKMALISSRPQKIKVYEHKTNEVSSLIYSKMSLYRGQFCPISSQKIAHSSAGRASYGVSFVSITSYPSSAHYNDVIMDAMVSQITSLTIVYSTVYSRYRSKKTSKLRVTGLCAGNSPLTSMFSFDDVIMLSHCRTLYKTMVCWTAL